MSNIIIAVLMGLSVGNFVDDQRLINDTLVECHKIRKHRPPDYTLLNTMLLLERVHGIPDELRGFTLVAACTESGFNPLARGDWRTIMKRGKARRVSRAIGLLQLWPWWERKFDVDRRNPYQSTNAWLRHAADRFEAVSRKQCPKRWSERRKWQVAFTQVARGRVSKKNRYRCYQKSSHVKRFDRWQRRRKSVPSA